MADQSPCLKYLPLSTRKSLAAAIDGWESSGWRILLNALPPQLFSNAQLATFEHKDKRQQSPTFDILTCLSQNLYTIDEMFEVFARICASEAAFILKPNVLTPIVILEHPKSSEVAAGSSLELTVRVFSLPPPRYAWQFNGTPISGADKPRLVLGPITSASAGVYTCLVWNGTQELQSQPSIVLVGNVSTLPSGPAEGRPSASAKLALLIGNCCYARARTLLHPTNDAFILASHLDRLGFSTFLFCNLTKAEMDNAVGAFLSLLSRFPNAYAIFYFSGHGFEAHNQNYLVATDDVTAVLADSAISAQKVLSGMQGCRTKFSFVVLDVCRTQNEDAAQGKEDYRFTMEQDCSAVISYATTPNSKAFEKVFQFGGMYMNHLTKFIQQDCHIEALLVNVQQSLYQEARTHSLTASQVPCFQSFTKNHFSLHDPISPPLSDQALFFLSSLHRVPSTKTITTSGSLQLELHFRRVFSNVCVVDVVCRSSINNALLELNCSCPPEVQGMGWTRTK